MTNETPYTVPKEPGRWRALTFAALVHGALLAFLWIGVHWQNETPTTIEAEVWSLQPRDAAPRPEPVTAPEPKPAPPEPKPEPKPVIPEPPKPKVEEPPVVKPDIALEQEKKRKEEERKRVEDERREKERVAMEKKRREEEEKLAKEKKRRDEEEKLAKEKKRREEEERLAKIKQQEEAKRIAREKEERAKKEAAEKKRKQEEADAQIAAQLREENMRRITGSVTGTGGSGDAARTQGGRASGEYAAKVRARIKSNTIYVVSDDVAANVPVEYLVELLPDGTLRNPPRKLKSSGIAGFDEAVQRAIEKSQPFPRDDKTGAVPSSFIVSHKPKDQ